MADAVDLLDPEVMGARADQSINEAQEILDEKERARQAEIRRQAAQILEPIADQIKAAKLAGENSLIVLTLSRIDRTYPFDKVGGKDQLKPHHLDKVTSLVWQALQSRNPTLDWYRQEFHPHDQGYHLTIHW